ncbi:hypothetical protein FALBO_6679 [Fusarium albosuccineum]|uniref:Uncharacterized protein n=1 Tax=Fusarium albosuccineum TaxID=1237068 RepID=A0A8H4LB77_9HYPO|nr:hypothetical protein FALBO_6679 [Fusarium albosuccineum]
MTENQYSRFRSWQKIEIQTLPDNDGASETRPQKSWRKIYESVFPGTHSTRIRVELIVPGNTPEPTPSPKGNEIPAPIRQAVNDIEPWAEENPDSNNYEEAFDPHGMSLPRFITEFGGPDLATHPEAPQWGLDAASTSNVSLSSFLLDHDPEICTTGTSAMNMLPSNNFPIDSKELTHADEFDTATIVDRGGDGYYSYGDTDISAS